VVWFRYQVVNDRLTEIRNENEDLKSAAVIADELHQKVLTEKGMLEMNLNRASDENSNLVQQVCFCSGISGQLATIFCLRFQCLRSGMLKFSEVLA